MPCIYMLLDAVALMLAIRCRSEVATLQLLRVLAESGTGRSPKTTLGKILALLKHTDRSWLEELYGKF